MSAPGTAARRGVSDTPTAPTSPSRPTTRPRDIFVSGNPAAGMQAFMEGRVKVQGDLTKLMAAQATGAGPGAPGLAEALSAITE